MSFRRRNKLPTLDSRQDDGSLYKDFKDDFAGQIDRIQSSGSFATFGSVELVNPGISVNGIGVIRQPLSYDDAQALIGASQPAPFGKGSETLLDESVRKTWQINADDFRILNSTWQTCLGKVLKTVSNDLGIASGSRNIRAELYKMLLYDKGAMFKAHKDSEKIPYMFGTLVFCLPSKHEGGAVNLQHGGKKQRFETSGSSAFNTTFMAWYADVIHEIEPVQDGHRWVLTYNLIYDSEDQDLTASILDSRTESLTQCLMRWQNLEEPPRAFSWPLTHEYTNQGLCLRHLKGVDYHRARSLAQSCTDSGEILFFLANIVRRIEESNDDHYEEKTKGPFITHMVDMDGFCMPYRSEWRLSESLLLSNIYTEEREPDSKTGGEYCGNEHEYFHSSYRNSVVILVAKSQFTWFMLAGKATVVPLNELIEKLREFRKERPHDQTAQELLDGVYRDCLSAKYKDSAARDHFMGALATSAAIDDPTVFSSALENTKNGWDGASYTALGKAVRMHKIVVPDTEVFGALMRPQSVHKVYDALSHFRDGFLHERTDASDAQCLERRLLAILLDRLLNITDAYPEDGRPLISMLLQKDETVSPGFSHYILYQCIRKFVDRSLHNQGFVNSLMKELHIQVQEKDKLGGLSRDLFDIILDSTVSRFNLDQWAGPPSRDCETPQLIKKFYEWIPTDRDVVRSELLGKIRSQAATLPQAQVPDFLPRLIQQMMTVVDISRHDLIPSLVSAYIGKEPEKPTNWARNPHKRPRDPDGCLGRCESCCQFEAFLRDPDTSEHIVDRNLFQHISHTFEVWDLKEEYDMDAQTVMLTKTLDWWHSKHESWELRRISATDRLREFPQNKLRECLKSRYNQIMRPRRLRRSERIKRQQKLKDGEHARL